MGSMLNLQTTLTAIMPTVAALIQRERRAPKSEGIRSLKDLVRRHLPPASTA